MYQEKIFNFPEMSGLSQKQIEEHLKLYAGYVKNTNNILAKIAELKNDSEKNALALSELVRRFPFEWNGMRMHEYYFDVLGGNGEPPHKIKNTIESAYGNFDAWCGEFTALGLMRGIGWVTLIFDKQTKNLHNIWTSDHEIGHLAGSAILLTMDVWEHAYLIDYPPTGRKDYIGAFLKNVNWGIVETRLSEAQL